MVLLHAPLLIDHVLVAGVENIVICCRQENDLLFNLPIGTSFEPQNISWSLQVGNPTTGMLFLLRFTHILFSKSIPNFNAIMPSNRAGPYDHNGTTFNSIPILEGEIRNLPGFCLPILSGQRRRFRAHIIYRRKGLFNWNTSRLRSWESAQ